MRLIDANVLQEKIRQSKLFNPYSDPYIARNHDYEHDHFMKMVASQPTAKEEVVRCKDCKWWENGLCESDDVARKINDCGCYPDFRTNSDWYCADGERAVICE